MPRARTSLTHLPCGRKHSLPAKRRQQSCRQPEEEGEIHQEVRLVYQTVNERVHHRTGDAHQEDPLQRTRMRDSTDGARVAPGSRPPIPRRSCPAAPSGARNPAAGYGGGRGPVPPWRRENVVGPVVIQEVIESHPKEWVVPDHLERGLPQLKADEAAPLTYAEVGGDSLQAKERRLTTTRSRPRLRGRPGGAPHMTTARDATSTPAMFPGRR